MQNTALPGAKNRNALRGLILLLVLAGILGTIYVVARQRPPKLTPEQMIVAGADASGAGSADAARSHGVSLREERSGKTGIQTPGGMSGKAASGGSDAGAGMARKDEPPHPPSHYTGLPGLDISSYPDETQRRILERANHEHCSCKCGMTLAECRNEDSTCRHSLTDVAAIVAKEAGDDIKKGLIKD
jgi:hypothetical protein